MAGYESNLKALQEHLDEGESVVVSCCGTYETTIMGSDTIRTGVLVATRRRVIFFAKKMFGFDLETFDMARVTAVEMSKGLMGKSIKLIVPGNEVRMKWINAGNPDGFVDYVREASAVASRTSLPAPSPVLSAPAASIPEQIKQLASLRDAGVLTEAEFSSKKAELLARM